MVLKAKDGDGFCLLNLGGSKRRAWCCMATATSIKQTEVPRYTRRCERTESASYAYHEGWRRHPCQCEPRPPVVERKINP